MDKIFIKGMKAETLIGVYEWERQQPQTLLIDLEIGINLESGANDNIQDTIHYGDVCQKIRNNLQSCNFSLLETLAEHIAQVILKDFGAMNVVVKVIKPGILPDVKEVGVEIIRS